MRDRIPGPNVVENDVVDHFVGLHNANLVAMFDNEIKQPLTSNHVTVTNLSNHHLSNTELSLLEKGLSFCPTPGEPHMGDLRRDLDKFHRNLRINTFFDPDNNGAMQNPPARNISALEKEIRTSKVLKPNRQWEPPNGPISLEAFILNNENDLNKTTVRAPRSHNLNKVQKQALKTLKDNRDIVIKQADKGGGTVIQNRDDYIKEGERQLSDKNFYAKLESDPTELNNLRINFFLNNLTNKGELTKSLETSHRRSQHSRTLPEPQNT